MLSIIDIIEETTVDGPGFRTAIYAAGCPNHCPGCHNPETWDIRRGHWVSTEEILDKVLADDFSNVTFSGGDPMFQPEGFAQLAKAIKERSQKNIWCYTGAFCCSISTCWSTAAIARSCATRASFSAGAATNG